MSKYIKKFDNYPNKNITDVGKKTLYPNIDEIKRNEIFANITGSPLKLFDLITPDIKLTFTDNDNNTVIHILVGASNSQVSEDTKLRLLEFFINRGAPVNSYNKFGLTPLHIAINSFSVKIVDFLLKHGANSNAEVVRTKLLPLHLAIKSSVGVCIDLAIPQQLAPGDKKDIDELRNKINNKIISTFDSRFFNIFCTIFDDYRDGYNNDKVKQEFESEIIAIIGLPDINPTEKEKLITDKVQSRIIDITKEIDRIDKSELFPNYMDYLTKDFQQINDEFHDKEIQKIQQNEQLVYQLYDQNFNNLTATIKEINNYYDAYIEYFKLHLLYVSKSIYINPANGYRYSRFFIFTNNLVNNFRISINPLNNLVAPIQVMPPTDLDDIPNFINNINLLENQILLLEIDQITKNKITKIKNDLVNLFKIKELINYINLNSFNRFTPARVLIPERNSYKFILLNYIKICKLLELINVSTSTINRNLSDGDGDKKLLKIFMDLNITDTNAVLPPIPAAAIAGLPNPIPAYDSISLILQVNTGDDKLRSKKFNDHKKRMNIKNRESDLKLKLCTPNFDNIIKLFNDINESKYFLKFTVASNLPYTGMVANLQYYTKYFDIKIEQSIKQKKHIKYFDLPRIPPMGAPAIPNPEVIINRAVGGIIFSIDDLYSPPLTGGIPPSVYQGLSLPNKSFKILRGVERIIIGQILDNQVAIDNQSLNNLNLSVNESQSYIERSNDDINIVTVGNQPIILLRNIIIKYTLDTTLALIRRVVPRPPIPAGTPITIDPEINDLLHELNTIGIDEEKIYVELVKNITDELLTELFKYYKTHCAREILRTIATNQSVRQYFTSFDTHFNIDIKKLVGLDYRQNKAFFLDQSIGPAMIPKFYKYNYITDDEANLCYKNRVEIVKNLLGQPGINYMMRDIEGNSLLHYLVDVENKDLFERIYGLNVGLFNRMKKSTNNSNKTPIEILTTKIKTNDINFYIILNNSTDENKLLFSNIFSSELKTKLINNKELYSLIPNKVENMFNDLYVIFNLENVCTDIFRIITRNVRIIGRGIRYIDLFNYSKQDRWSLRASQNINNIKDELYTFLQNRHSIQTKYISNNEYVERYENSIAHVITLHFSNVFVQMIEKLLLESNMLRVVIQDPNPAALPPAPAPGANVSRIAIDSAVLASFKNAVFDFDYSYKIPNLAQQILINLMDVKYNENTVKSKSFSSLQTILEFYISKLDTSIVESRLPEFREQMTKIYDYLNIYFDLFNKKLRLFLTNYVKFIELQYNLQKNYQLIMR